MRFPDDGYYSIFLEHSLDEFCQEDCFRYSRGRIIDFLFIESRGTHSDEHDHKEKAWGSTMGGAFVVWAAVFSGMILLGAGQKNYDMMTEDIVHLISMFAAGALLSTAFCLVLLEASHFISSSELTESGVSALWGAMVLVGFLTATIIDMLKEVVVYAVQSTFLEKKRSALVVNVVPEVEDAELSNQSNTEKGGMVEMTVVRDDVTLDGSKGAVSAHSAIDRASKSANGMVTSILVGDFLHNFCDGVFIGAAFQSCSRNLAWTIVATTACHEIAQEIADFIILTKVAKLPIHKALMVNAASGISVVLGGIAVNVVSLSDLSIGVLLAFGAGNYIFLAASELFPSFHASDKDNKRALSVSNKIFGLILFVLGALAVGLVLLNHEHCETEAEEDAHQHDH